MSDKSYLGSVVYKEAMERLDEARLFVRIADAGLHQALTMTKRREAIANWHATVEDISKTIDLPAGPKRRKAPTAEELQRDQEIELWAQREHEQGWPYMHGLVAVRIWSTLETYVDELIQLVLVNLDPAAAPKDLRRLRIRYYDFVHLDELDRRHVLLEEFKHLITRKLSPNEFVLEALLKPIGLSGHVHSTMERALKELRACRNILVHRGGRADHHTVERCPSLRMKSGDLVALDSLKLVRFALATIWYVQSLDGRCRTRAGVPESPGRKEALERLLAKVKDLDGKLLKMPSAAQSARSTTPKRGKARRSGK